MVTLLLKLKRDFLLAELDLPSHDFVVKRSVRCVDEFFSNLVGVGNLNTPLSERLVYVLVSL
jgi:hypothetical protein